MALSPVVTYQPINTAIPVYYPSGPAPSKQVPTGAQSSVTPFYPAPAGFRRPRAFLTINGRKLAVTKMTTNSTSHFTPDSWTAECSLYQQPQGFTLKDWDTFDPSTLVNINYGLLANSQNANEFPKSSTNVLTGQIDDIVLDLTEGTVSLTGRDLTARLVDNKTANRWPNLTSSQVVTLICQMPQFNLTPQVTATTTPIGEYFNEGGYSASTSGTPYWDLITYLAQQENFDAYVSGTTLYFGPSQADTDKTPWVFYVKSDGNGRVWGNVKSMQLKRNANLSKDISITVISHNAKTGRSFQVNAARAGVYIGASSRSRSADTVQSYVFRKPGMTPAQAQDFANAELNEISKFEKEYTVTLEGDPGFSVRKMTQVIGTGTDFDTNYYVRTISREYSVAAGFEMTINGKNQPTENQANVPGAAA
jgi:phage protein D